MSMLTFQRLMEPGQVPNRCIQRVVALEPSRVIRNPGRDALPVKGRGRACRSIQDADTDDCCEDVFATTLSGIFSCSLWSWVL